MSLNIFFLLSIPEFYSPFCSHILRSVISYGLSFFLFQFFFLSTILRLWLNADVSTFHVCTNSAVSGILVFLPSLLEKKGIDSGNMYANVFYSCLGNIPGVLVSAYLLEVWGRRSADSSTF